MPKGSAIAVLGAAAVSLVVWLLLPAPPSQTSNERPAPPATNSVDPARLCAWRDPSRDLPDLFPGATNCRSEVRILTSRRAELAKRLGRQPDADEEVLRVHRVLAPGSLSGVVLVRRVKGENGPIELVLGVDNGGAVRGLRLQRASEPEAVMAFLRSPEWQRSLVGRRLDDSSDVVTGPASVPAAAARSARSLAEGVRGLLAMLETSNNSPVPVLSDPGHVIPPAP